MINLFEVKETNEMITKENLDVRTITLGISLMDCIDSNLDKVNRKIYDKITTMARNLVAYRRGDRGRIRRSHRQQADFRDPDRSGGRFRLQDSGGFCGP